MKNKNIVIVGGNAGALIAEEIFLEQYKKVLFLETYASTIDKKRIIAEKIIDGINFLKRKDTDYFIATGDNMIRKQNFETIFAKTKKYPVNCIHETAFISKSSALGFGNLICPLSVIHVGVKIKNNTIINTLSVIDHDCLIEDYAQVSPNATLCGRIEVGEGAFIGAGSVIIPGVRIGKNSVIAAGSSVINNVDKNTMVAGVPARFKKNIK